MQQAFQRDKTIDAGSNDSTEFMRQMIFTGVKLLCKTFKRYFLIEMIVDMRQSPGDQHQIRLCTPVAAAMPVVCLTQQIAEPDRKIGAALQMDAEN